MRSCLSAATQSLPTPKATITMSQLKISLYITVFVFIQMEN